jgi:DEAD/DEAH box helicase domain-containing protein
MATLIFDLETQHLADEVGGWDNIAKMKLACAVTLNAETGEFTHYLESDVDKLLAKLRAASLVVGFNINRFDYEVLRPYAGGTALKLPTVDMLVDIYRALGFRLSLDSIASATLGTTKSADGLLAVKWFRAGEVQKVLDYCQQDVCVTRDVYNFGRQNKHIKYRDKYGRIKTVPVRW